MEEIKRKIGELYKLKKYKEAFRLLETLEKDLSGDFEFLKLKTSLLGLLNRRNEGLIVADLALTINNRDEILWHMKGVFLLESRRYEEALVALDRCLELDPYFYRAILKKIQTLLCLKKYREAIDLYEESDLPAFDHDVPFNNLGFGYIQLGNFDKAVYFLSNAKKFNKFQASIYYNFSQISKKKGEKWKYFKNISKFVFLKILDFIKIGRILFKFTPSNDFQEKKEIFDGPGKLFKTKSEEKETKSILKILRTPNAMALCNEWWEWVGVNVPYNIVHDNSFKGDIDILIKRPNNVDGYDLGFSVRAFEVKTTKVDKKGEIIGGRHRGKGKLDNIRRQIKKLKEFGFEQVFFAEIFILERGYSQSLSFPSAEIMEEIERKKKFLESFDCGYVVFADEPSSAHDDETGGILHKPINVLSPIQNGSGIDSQSLTKGIDEFRKSLGESLQSNKNLQCGFFTGIVSFCPNCKRVTLLESVRNVQHNCFFCKKKIY